MLAVLLLPLIFRLPAACADWPMLRGNPAHTGFVAGQLTGPFRLAWVREIEDERLGTAMEPIISGEKVFVATHAGNVYALRSDTGEALWRFEANGAFLHSPAIFRNLVLAGSTDGNVYALETDTGKPAWSFYAGYGGFSAAPLIFDDAVYLGTRNGNFLALSAKDGKLLWQQSPGIPIRQTGAAAEGQVFVTAEDLKVRCYRTRDGRLEWTSSQMAGQTARDYYPIVIQRGGPRFVIVRTNPLLNMGQRIARDRSLLCRLAGVDDSTWQKLDAWTKSDQARGNPELWAKEQEGIAHSLEAEPEARTFFVLDATTGKQAGPTPVLWVGGCQGVGVQPALTGDGRLLVLGRSAYGNWNLGVAPLVALGLLDLERNVITPLFHQQGRQPRWNCFWGTADESQNFVVVGNTVLIIHQGTLSGFDLKTNELFPIYGERDTYGGFFNPPWARNEWHGPARSGVAVVGNRIYWQTGSRILCVLTGDAGPSMGSRKPLPVAKNVPTATTPKKSALGKEALRGQLRVAVKEVLSQRWAPLFTDPGLAGRSFSFDHSGELFEALAWAYPHLGPDLQTNVIELLQTEWSQHPPFTGEGWYSLSEGARREWFAVPTNYCARLGGDKQPDPFGNVYAAWLFARRCGQESFVLESWPKLKASFEHFIKSGWRLDAAKGELFANRYLASLLSFGQLAERAGDSARARQAAEKAAQTAAELASWWRRVAEAGALGTFNKAAELDPFIGKGNGFWLAVAPHRHKLALFEDLTPEVAGLVSNKAPVRRVWESFAVLCPTWSCTGEERQVHFGENFVDPPDFALSAFRAMAWLNNASADELARRVDLPFCRADLYYIIKVAVALDRNN